jgi:hypothetical protein
VLYLAPSREGAQAWRNGQRHQLTDKGNCRDRILLVGPGKRGAWRARSRSASPRPPLPRRRQSEPPSRKIPGAERSLGDNIVRQPSHEAW